MFSWPNQVKKGGLCTSPLHCTIHATGHAVFVSRTLFCGMPRSFDPNTCSPVHISHGGVMCVRTCPRSVSLPVSLCLCSNQSRSVSHRRLQRAASMHAVISSPTQLDTTGQRYACHTIRVATVRYLDWCPFLCTNLGRIHTTQKQLPAKVC